MARKDRPERGKSASPCVSGSGLFGKECETIFAIAKDQADAANKDLGVKVGGRGAAQAQATLKAATEALEKLGDVEAALAAVAVEVGDRVELALPPELRRPAHLDDHATELLRAQMESGPLARSGATGTVLRLIGGAEG